MYGMQYILPLLLSGITGWLVTYIFIKILFRPHKPISFAGFSIQGIIPANQEAVAKKIGNYVSEELFSFSALQEKIIHPDNFNKLKPEIEKHIETFLRVRLKDTFPMLSMLMGDKTINQLKTAFLLELESLFPVIMKNYVAGLEKDLDLEKMVTEKIAGFPLNKAEALMYQLGRRQLLKLQLLGACIGFVMGLVHILINTQLFL